MKQEIDAIILDMGNYASNDKPRLDENGIIVPFFLHYTDANLLMGYISELEEENKKLKQALEEAQQLFNSKYFGLLITDYDKLNEIFDKALGGEE